MDVEQKYGDLKAIIGGLKKVVVAFSGGMDSTLLLKTSIDVLGNGNVIAVTGNAPIFPVKTVHEARKTAKHVGAQHLVVDTAVLKIDRFLENSADRCYYCKRNLFGILFDIAGERGISCVVDGTNFDDTDDFRPGGRAVKEMGVVSPLLLAGLTKDDIAYLSGRLYLPTQNMPPDACLSTRVPYGTRINASILKRIELAEDLIKATGISSVRVRHHGRIARIEVSEADIEKIISEKEMIIEGLKRCGFSYVALDLEGYRMGSMNEGKQDI